ncbi:MAG: glycosyltransferase [Aeromicrobium sp.]
MTNPRTTTLLVEPDPTGHHFQAVAAVTGVASESGPVVLLTLRGASAEPSFEVYLAADVRAGRLVVHEVFEGKVPSTAEMARVAATWCRRADVPVGTLMLMDGDQALKRWWYVARPLLRGLAHRPRVIFMLTRYPARLALTDLTGWRLRAPKAVLVVAARLTGTLHRAVGFSGREDTAAGWLVKRVRDPHYSSAHSRDRATWRAELGLPADRHLVGVFGALGERKNAPLILDAIKAAGLDADLVLAGVFQPEVRAWVDDLDDADRARVIARDGFLSNEELDRFVAAVDVVPLALTNNGPSGIMGNAEAAGVPVVTTGSTVRAREVRATGAGLACDFTAESIGAAMRQVLHGPFTMPAGIAGGEVTADEFGRVLLGVAPR